MWKTSFLNVHSVFNSVLLNHFVSIRLTICVKWAQFENSSSSFRLILDESPTKKVNLGLWLFLYSLHFLNETRENRVLQTPDFLSVQKKNWALQKQQTDLEALHFICFSSPGIHDFLEAFFDITICFGNQQDWSPA